MGNVATALDDALAQRLAEHCWPWIAENPQRAVVVHVARRGRTVVAAAFGSVQPLDAPGGSRPARIDDIYLVASPTKPLVALAVCMLVERGRLLLDDRVSTFLPSFAGSDRAGVRVRHLLTHTSGLPDMLPDNVALRERHAPLADFVAASCATPLLFKPGADCRYQSMGILLVGAIVEHISGMALPDFLHTKIFAPLGMRDTWLGTGHLDRTRLARVMETADAGPTTWGWNSDYWRNLGAPWGGLQTTASDYTRVLRLMLGGGAVGRARLLGPATVDAMLANQLDALPALSAHARAENAWGLGWRLNQPAGAHGLPELAPPYVFGHAGATGTVVWADAQRDLTCVILTNDPTASSFRSRLSNIVSASV